MREFRPYGSVRGAPSDGRPYRNLVASETVKPFVKKGKKNDAADARRSAEPPLDLM